MRILRVRISSAPVSIRTTATCLRPRPHPKNVNTTQWSAKKKWERNSTTWLRPRPHPKNVNTTWVQCEECQETWQQRVTKKWNSWQQVWVTWNRKHGPKTYVNWGHDRGRDIRYKTVGNRGQFRFSSVQFGTVKRFDIAEIFKGPGRTLERVGKPIDNLWELLSYYWLGIGGTYEHWGRLHCQDWRKRRRWRAL